MVCMPSVHVLIIFFLIIFLYLLRFFLVVGSRTKSERYRKEQYSGKACQGMAWSEGLRCWGNEETAERHLATTTRDVILLRPLM